MQQTRTITPFMVSLLGVDHRILRDVGLDTEGNFLDDNHPRLRRRPVRRPFARVPDLLSVFGLPPHNPAQPLLNP